MNFSLFIRSLYLQNPTCLAPKMYLPRKSKRQETTKENHNLDSNMFIQRVHKIPPELQVKAINKKKSSSTRLHCMSQIQFTDTMSGAGVQKIHTLLKSTYATAQNLTCVLWWTQSMLRKVYSGKV